MSDTPSLEDRITELEDLIERMKRVGLLLAILMLVMGATMIYQSNTLAGAVTTDGLIISNAGKPRGAVTAMPTGHLGMIFYDFQGNLPAAQYNAIPYLDGIAVYDRNGRPRILIGMDEQDQPILAVVSPKGEILFSAVPPGAGATTPSPSPTPAATATPTPAP